MKKNLFSRGIYISVLIIYLLLDAVLLAQIQSAQSGNWSSSTTWVGGIIPNGNDAVIINANHQVTLDNSAFATRNANTTVNLNGTLTASVTCVNNASMLVNGSFKLISGGWATGNNFVYGTSSNLIFDLGSGFYEVYNTDVFWPITNGPKNVYQATIPSSALPAGLRLNNMTRTVEGIMSVDAGIHLSNASLILNGTVQINTNGYFNDAPIYGNNSTLIYNTGLSYNNGNEWNAGGNNTATAGLGIPHNVTIQNGTQLNMFAARGIAGNLVIKDANSKLNLGNNIGDDLFLKGNLNIQIANGLNANNRAVVFINNALQTIQSVSNPLTLSYVSLESPSGNTNVQLQTDLNITAPNGGNAISFLNSTDVLDINSRTLTIGTTGVGNTIAGTGKFKGSNTSKLTLLGNGSIGIMSFLTGFQTLGNLTINRQAGQTAVTLGSSVVILNNLTLTNGNVELKHNYLTLGATTTLTGGSANSFVISEKSNGGGRLRKYVNAKITYFFPVGDNPNSNAGSEYTPLEITLHSGILNSSAFIEVATENAKHTTNDSPVDYLLRYWVLNSQNTVNLRYSVNAYYTNADIYGTEDNSVAGQWNGTQWLEHIHIGSNILKLEGLTDFPLINEITAGNPLKGREINVRGNGLNISSGDTTPDNYDNTFFGTTLVDGGTIDKTFVIENVGNLPLSINGVTITGTNASDFSIITNPANNILEQTSSNLIIRFNPSAIGLRNATVSIQNNDTNENPYTFAIRGGGSTAIPCSSDVIIVQQDFEDIPNEPLYNYTTYVYTGSVVVSGGYAFANGALKNKYLGQESLQIFNTDAEINFNSINTSFYSNVELSFNLASLGGNSGIGTNSGDVITVSVSANGGAYSDEIIIIGNVNSNWSFADGLGAASKIYSGTNTPVTFQTPTGNQTTNALKTIVLSQLPAINDLRIKFRLKSGSESRIWSVDNVMLKGTAPAKVWNGTAWSGLNTFAPNAYEKVLLAENYNTNLHGSFVTCECEVATGKSLLITANQYVEIHNRLINYGTVTVENDGNLIQRNDTSVNVGNIKVKRNANLKRLDYNYWGSSVAGQNLKAFSPGTLSSRFYTYNEADDFFYVISPTANNFIPGKGYAIRAPNDFSTTNTVFNGEFFGAPNNGVIAVNVAKSTNGYNLVANPYASNINFANFFTVNSSVINNIAYFWTNVNPNPEMQGANYPNGGFLNNYAIYNGSGGVPATGPAQNGTVIPNQYIKVGQGFIIQAKNNGTVTFNNSMRTNNTTARFFNKMAKNANEETNNRFWLQLTTPLNVANKILIAYKKEATNDFEIDYDAPHLIIGADSFYSILGEHKLAIQGRKYPLMMNEVIPIGASFYAPGNYTISLAEKEGVFANGQAIFIKDKISNTLVNLQTEDYTFAVQTAGENTDRFELVFIDKAQNNSGNNDAALQEIRVIDQADHYLVISKNEKILELYLSNALGNFIKKYTPKNKSILIPKSELPLPGVYFIKGKTETRWFEEKIIK